MKHSSFLIAFLATIIRYYDYALFGLSASILAKNFLPLGNIDQQLLGFFAIFSAVVIARPLGSIIFGFIGDKYGRAASVKISVIFAAISTSLIGIVPGFDRIGAIATIALIFCRMVFLMSLAGEIDSVKVYVAEKIGSTRKNLANGVVSSCSQIGALFAAVAYHYSIKSEYVEYLWRMNFIIGGIFGLLIIIMRNYFQESEEFLNYKASHNNAEADNLSLLQIINSTKERFFIALIISGCMGGVYNFLVIFLGTFIAKIAFIITPHEAQIMNIILIMAYGIMSVFAGFLADKINPKKQIIVSLVLSLLTLIIMRSLLQKQIFLVYPSVMLIAFAPFYIVPLQIIIQYLFPTNIRIRMYSLSHSLGGMIFSSTTPFFCMLLWQYSHSLLFVFGFFMTLIVILLSSVIYLYKYAIIDS